MKNKLLQYIQEVVMPQEYRDTQVAKIVNSSKPDEVIQNFYIDNIVFFKGFLDKILNHLMTFPDELDKKNDVYTMDEPSGQENPNALDDEDEDENEEEDYYEESVKYTPYQTKVKEQTKKSVNEMGVLTVNTLKKDILDFKNGNFADNDLMLYIKRKSPEFADLANKKIYNETFYKYLYCGILNYYDRYNFLRRLIEFRGKNYVWLISHIKDSTFSSYYRKNLTGKIGKKTRERAVIKAIIPNFDKQPFRQSMEELDKYISGLKDEKEIKKAKDIKNKFQRDPSAYLLEELSIMDARTKLMILFKNIKRRFMQDPRFNKNFTAIGSRKFIFDYETGKPSTLNNEVLTDANQLKDLLLKLGYSFNEIEFEVGKVRKDKQLYSLKELIPVLKQKMTEIKTFSEDKVAEMMELSKELDALPVKESLELKIKNVENEQIKAIKAILSYDDKTDKKLGELIKEGMSTKKEETNAILKKHNKTKLNKLLALVKEREEIEKENQEITVDDYQQTIDLISDFKVIGSNQKFKIIFTLSPRVFISQSTRANLAKNIKSCMNVFYGLNRKFLVTSLFDGSFIAFLVKVNKDKDGNDLLDSKIIDPVARCVIKPYRSSNGEIFWVPDNVYEEDGAMNYGDLSSKIAEILSMNNMLPKDTYYLNDKANYLDSVDNIRNDIFTDLYYNNDKLKKKMESEPLSTLLYLKTRFRDRFGNTNAFKKIHEFPQGNEIFNTISFDNTLDMSETPKIKTSEIAISGTKIKRLHKDTITQSLEIAQNSEIRNIDNLKNIKDIKKLRILNGAKVSKEILQNENLIDFTYCDGSINDNIKTKNAKIYFDAVNINCESIECDSIFIDNSNLNKIKKIEARAINFKNFIFDDFFNRKIEKIKKEFVPLIKSSNEFLIYIKEYLSLPNKLKEKFSNANVDDDKKNYDAYQYIARLNAEDYDFIYKHIVMRLSKILPSANDGILDDRVLSFVFIKRAYLDLSKIDATKLQELRLTRTVTVSKETVIDLRRFKNLKYLQIIKSDNSDLPKIFLPSSIVKLDFEDNMNSIENLPELVNLKSIKFTNKTDFTNWPDNILKNIVNINNMYNVSDVNKYSLRKIALTPFFQLSHQTTLKFRDDKITDIIENNKSQKINKAFVSPMEIKDNNDFDLDNLYSDNIIFSFKSKEKQDRYRNKIFYFKPNLYSNSSINIENDFFDFYLSSFLSDENILLQGDVGYSLKISVKLNDKSPKIIDLRKITEKIEKSSNSISIFIHYDATNRRDFTIISNCLIYEGGVRNSKETMKYNNFLIMNELESQRSLASIYTYYVRDKEKTINLNRLVKIKKHYTYNASIKLDFSDYLYDFHMKHGEMFSKITSKEEKEKAFDNFIKTHVKPLTINMSELQKKISTLTFFLYISKNYYGDYKIVSRLMEKYLYMCQGTVLTTIIDPNMESRLEK